MHNLKAPVIKVEMNTTKHLSQSLAESITKAGSRQTYYTIRLLVDRPLVADAFRAYGYFRWVDDIIDGLPGTTQALGKAEALEKIAFINRQKALLEACYHGVISSDLCPEEYMLVDLVRNNSGENPGLQSYLRNMMVVMEFDAGRRGRVISQAELTEYSRLLAAAVTDALYYFIGHDNPPPSQETRYLPVIAAHITHMLRDTVEDVEVGYYNIPIEYLQAHGISESAIESQAYRKWVCDRIRLAHSYFRAGWQSLSQVRNLRCRLAGFAYMARFDWVLHAIERDNYCLRAGYSQRKGLYAGLWMVWKTLRSMLASLWVKDQSHHPAT